MFILRGPTSSHTWISWYCEPRRNVRVAVNVLFRRLVVLNSCWAWRARRFVANEKNKRKINGNCVKADENRIKSENWWAEPTSCDRPPSQNWLRAIRNWKLSELTDSRLLRRQQGRQFWRIAMNVLRIAWISLLIKLRASLFPSLCFVRAHCLLLLSTRHLDRA